MGKPFKSELKQLPHTYQWALSLPIRSIQERVHTIVPCPLIAIGSGGSQSTATLIADLHQARSGQVARSDTPLNARNYIKEVKRSAVLLVSAGGKNPDILGIAKMAIESEPASLIAICSTKDSPLSRLVMSFARGFCFDFELPSGKDGFLATNSLLALSTVALKTYNISDDLPVSLEIAREGTRELPSSPRALTEIPKLRSIVVLHGPKSRSVALDLESKLTESGLASVQVADYRNFAHGRHHWFAKNPDSGVIAFANAEETDLGDRTLKLLPRSIPSLLIANSLSSYSSWVGLQAVVFDLVAQFGDTRRIDPGRPGVPEFGRRIYHLNAFPRTPMDVRSTAIWRKARASILNSRGPSGELETAFSLVCAKFHGTKFHGLVLDYDGTVCDHADRYRPIPKPAVQAINRIVRAGFSLGIATGRGKSVREALQGALPRNRWSLVQIGYYNGAVIAPLSDEHSPDTACCIRPELKRAAEVLEDCSNKDMKLTVRPQQITVESRAPTEVLDLWFAIMQRLQESGVKDVKAVASTRSVDIVVSDTTKLSLLRALQQMKPTSNFLCIGDRPAWPGNDSELLRHEFSLSVDEVDASPSSAWNLAPPGVLGAAALHFYLSRIKIDEDYFSIHLG